jgi:hypothetical protein
MATPTGLYMNWTGVVLTPSTGSAINVAGVTGIGIGRSSRQEPFYGDMLQFARLIMNVEKKRSITIAAAAIASFLAVSDDLTYTIVATLADPRNGIATGGGAITVTLTGGVLEKDQSDGQNNKYATGTVTFNCQGSVVSGSEVDPLSWVAL